METDPQFTSHTIRQERADGSVKVRELMVPSDELMQEHREMLRDLYDLDIPMPFATGGLPGKDLLDNVRPHRQNDHFYMTDLTDAFKQVDTMELIRRMHFGLWLIDKPHNIVDWDQQVANIVEFIVDKATTPQVPGLPLGAPASPFLFNVYCLPMDSFLGRWCRERDITYTRYLDDLTFSAEEPIGKIRRSQIREIIDAKAGIPINHAKSRVHSLEKGPVTITGVSLYPDRRLGPNPVLMEKVRVAFAELGAVALSGGMLYDDEIGRLHGYHGTLGQLSDGETPTLRRFAREYAAIRELLVAQ